MITASNIYKNGFDEPSNWRNISFLVQSWQLLVQFLTQTLFHIEDFESLIIANERGPFWVMIVSSLSRIPEPTEESETDPQDNEKDISDE